MTEFYLRSLKSESQELILLVDLPFFCRSTKNLSCRMWSHAVTSLKLNQDQAMENAEEKWGDTNEDVIMNKHKNVRHVLIIRCLFSHFFRRYLILIVQLTLKEEHESRPVYRTCHLRTPSSNLPSNNDTDIIFSFLNGLAKCFVTYSLRSITNLYCRIVLQNLLLHLSIIQNFQ